VQVSRRELLAARVVELGLAPLLQGNRSGVIFPHHSPHFKRSPSPADRMLLCRSVIDHVVLPAERAAVLLAKKQSPHAATDR
jgi:hypothetical protein